MKGMQDLRGKEEREPRAIKRVFMGSTSNTCGRYSL